MSLTDLSCKALVTASRFPDTETKSAMVSALIRSMPKDEQLYEFAKIAQMFDNDGMPHELFRHTPRNIHPNCKTVYINVMVENSDVDFEEMKTIFGEVPHGLIMNPRSYLHHPYFLFLGFIYGFVPEQVRLYPDEVYAVVKRTGEITTIRGILGAVPDFTEEHLYRFKDFYDFNIKYAKKWCKQIGLLTK